MMNNSEKNIFKCCDCEKIYNKWIGQCIDCGSWDIAEMASNALKKTTLPLQRPSNLSAIEPSEKIYTKYKEIDRIFGNGITAGSVTLVGGDPGIGKSTLLLQLLDSLEKTETAYITGEESLEQIQLRAKRLNISSNSISVIANNNIEEIYEIILANKKTKFIVVDSIQTMKKMQGTGTGIINQIRQCTEDIVLYAKQHKLTTIIVGHVTKDGSLAGPKMLEHMVDTVIYFESNQNTEIRMMRVIKNRYGPTNEVCLLKMTAAGLQEVKNASSILIEERQPNAIGSVIFAGIEGTMPVLIEIQALVSNTYMVSPRRTVIGWDQNRLNMILAVLSSKCEMSFENKEVYLNVVGGIKLTDPAADIPAAIAIISALNKIKISEQICAFGEIGLCGEVRSARNTEKRIAEANKMGFTTLIAPKTKVSFVHKMNHIKINNVIDFKKILQFQSNNYNKEQIK